MATSLSGRYDLLAILVSSMALWFLVGSPYAMAQQGSASSERLVLSPDLRAFVENESSDASSEKLQQLMEQGARSQWELLNTEVTVIPSSTLNDSITEGSHYEGTLEIARQWGEMGMVAYDRVQMPDAIAHLENSLENFRQIHHDLVAPAEVSEIMMYLALSYLEDGTDVVRPLELFQEMIRQDPARVIESGYYPDFIVQYYENARRNLWRELRRDGPPPEESQRIAELSDARFVFHGYAIPTTDDHVELVAYMYDSTEEYFLPAETLTIDSADDALLTEGLSRLASRLSSCLATPRSDETDLTTSTYTPGTSRLFVQLAMSYGSFFDYPTPLEEPFGNYGLNLGVGWSVTSEFQFVGSLTIANSMRDYSGILRDNFTSVRAMAGGELGHQFGDLYIGLATGAEVAAFGPIRVFTDPSCIPDPDRLCPGDAGTQTFDESGLHWGVALRPRISWAFADSFKLSSAIGLAYYLSSPMEGQVLNLPVTLETGLQYRF